jgi:hypothetical protein
MSILEISLAIPSIKKMYPLILFFPKYLENRQSLIANRCIHSATILNIKAKICTRKQL